MKRSRCSLRVIGMVSMAVVVSGCQAMKNKSPSDLVRPLSEDLPIQAKSYQNGESERRICIETAKTVAEKGYVTEAIQLYEKAEGLEPEGPSLDLPLAPLYAQAGNTQKSIERYRNIIAQGKATAEVYNNFAWTLTESGQNAKAIEVIRQGLAAAPHSKRLRATHALILYRHGESDRAFALFRELYGPSAAHHNLAVLDVGSGKFDSAFEHAKLATNFSDCSAESIALRDAIQSRVAVNPSADVQH